MIGLGQWVFARRQRMRRRHREHRGDFGQRPGAVAAAGWRIAGRADDEVRAAVGQRVPRSAEHFVRHAQAGVRRRVVAAVHVESRDQRPDARRAARSRRRRSRARSPSPSPRGARGVRARRRRGSSSRPCVEQLAPGRREARAMPAPVEQQHVEILLERAHRVGDRRRHAVQLLGGAGEAAARSIASSTTRASSESRHVQEI